MNRSVFFLSPLIGIEFTDHTIRAVIARRSFWNRKKKKGIANIISRAEVKIPEHVLQNGAIKDREKFAEVFEGLFTELHLPMHGKEVVLCLPVNAVYTSVLQVPSLPHRTEEREDCIRNAAAAILPEESGNLVRNSRVLSMQPDRTTIGIAAVAKTLLQGYLDFCQDAGLTVRGVTSTSLMLAASIAEKGESPFLLVQGGMKGGGQITVTLFEALWPVDEDLFPEEAFSERMLERVRELLEEARNQGRTIERLFVHGGSAMMNAIRGANFPDLLIEEALPSLKLLEKKWGGALAASSLPTHTYINLLQGEGNTSVMWISVLLILLCIGSLGALAFVLFL